MADVTRSETRVPERWRTGRRVGRTIYIGDRLVGLMDTPELAARVVQAVNRYDALVAAIDEAGVELARALVNQPLPPGPDGTAGSGGMTASTG